MFILLEQEVILNSTLRDGRYARPKQMVVFTCEARNTTLMVWRSAEYIGGGGDQIEILSGGVASDETRLGGTVATRVNTSSDNGITVIVSKLYIIASEEFPSSSVTCAINGRGSSQTINFTTTGMRHVHIQLMYMVITLDLLLCKL